MRHFGVPNKETSAWPSGHRRCKKCLELLPLACFHKHKQCLHGYNTVCKTCRKPLSRQQWQVKRLEEKLVARCKSRAVLRGLPFDLEVTDLAIPSKCPVFGKPFVYGDKDWAPSVDRIDSTKGYVKGNVQVISNKANRMKSDASLEELRMFAKWVCEI